MPSLLEQQKTLIEQFNAGAAAMTKFIEEKNPLGFGGTTPAAEVVTQFDGMHQAQTKTREELDKIEELLNLSTEMKNVEPPPGVDIDAVIEQKLAARQAHLALSSAGKSTTSDRNRFVRVQGAGLPTERHVLDTEVMATMVGRYIKQRNLKVADFEKNGSTNHRFVFTWGEGQRSFDRDPQRFAGGVIERKSLANLEEEAMKALYTFSVNNPAPTGGAGELGFACNLDIDPDVCTIDNPDFCLTDCIPVRPTTGGRIWYTRQSVRVNNAAGVVETIECDDGVLKPESDYGFTTIEVPVITLAHVICVSDEAMDDCESMIDMVRGMMREDLLRKERQYIIAGTGVGGPNPQYRGILNTAGIITHTFRGAPRGVATDTIQDAIRRARTDIMLAGKNPDCVLINVRDAERMDLAKDTQNRLLYPNASCEVQGVWCLNVCADADVPEGTMIVGGLRSGARLYRRQEVVIEIGYTGNQFRLDTATIRAKMRGAFALKCPQGIVRVNSIV